MHIEAPHNSKLRDLHALIKDSKVLLRDAFLLLAQQEHALLGEFVIRQHLRVGCLLKSNDAITI